MSSVTSSLLAGVATGIVVAALVGFIVPDVDRVWWAAAIPAAADISGREFLAGSIGTGVWLTQMIRAVERLERQARTPS